MRRATGQPAEIFGPYRVFEQLGSGGVATVHLARKPGIAGFELVCGLKRLRPRFAADSEFVRSFAEQARRAAALQHANIVQIYELGQWGATYFMAMEYVPGRSLRAILCRARGSAGPMPAPLVLALLGELCDALDYAHHHRGGGADPDLGIVHSDLSPSNLIIGPDGHLKVLDFGIARATSRTARDDRAHLPGKLGYTAPETVNGAPPGPGADVFAAGILAHELLTARPLFSAASPAETRDKLMRTPIPRPSSVAGEVPAAVDELVMTALARAPEQRWPSAAALRDAIQRECVVQGWKGLNRQVSAWLALAFADTDQPGRDATSVPAWRPPSDRTERAASPPSTPGARANAEATPPEAGERDKKSVPFSSPEVPTTAPNLPLGIVSPAHAATPVPAADRPRSRPRPRLAPSRRRGLPLITPVDARPPTGPAGPRQRRARGTGDVPPASETPDGQRPDAPGPPRSSRSLGRGTGSQAAASPPAATPALSLRSRRLYWAIALGALAGSASAVGGFWAAAAAGAAVRGGAAGPVRTRPAVAATEFVQVSVDTAAPGFELHLDGVPVAQASPATLAVAPGPHEVALVDETTVWWRTRFTARAGHELRFAPGLRYRGHLVVPRAQVPPVDDVWPAGFGPARATVCIDADGRVTAVDLHAAPLAADNARAEMFGWRFRPFTLTSGGTRTPVCFALSAP
jgi:serine/threonine protein kinase